MGADADVDTSDPEDESADLDSQLEELVRDQAGGTCQGDDCDEADDLDVYNVGEGDELSMDDLKLLCPQCYAGEYLNQTLTGEEVLDHFDSTNLPFTTSGRIAAEFGVSRRTARIRLRELVDRDELSEHELDSGQRLFFRADFRAGEEFLERLREAIDLSELDPEKVEDFARKPYTVLPRGQTEQEYYVVTPRFLPFSLGHLFKQDDGFQTFVVNQHISWFDGIPDEIEEKISLDRRYEEAIIDDQYLKFASEEEREQAWEDFDGQDGPLVEREGDSKIKVQQGKEFEVIAQLIDGGNLPFVQEPIDSEDLRPKPTSITLRDYQQEAWETFEEYGQTGIFWPPGCGKTFAGLHFGDRIDGEKLVAVPTRLLKSQWEERIEEHTRYPSEWEVQTYQYLTHGDNLDEYQGENAPDMIVFDEAHIVPADTFSKLAMIDATYRLGLSASPYREDGREEYIFSLTGVPVGVDWQDLAAHGVVDYPEVWVYLYTTGRQRKADIKDLAANKPGQGLIYCDSLEEGEQLADELDVPFVNGETPPDERLETIRENKVVIISRVGDEGLSLSNIDWTIEYDYLGQSRRQEIQRAGRLMHSDHDGDDSEFNGQHILMMTDDEAEKFGDRLWSLEEKGIEVRYERWG